MTPLTAVEVVGSQIALGHDSGSEQQQQRAVPPSHEQVPYVTPPGLSHLHATNGNLALNAAALSSMHNVGTVAAAAAAGMIGQYTPVASVAAAAAAAAAAASRAGASTSKTSQ
ncbi:unnamed protein product, partial [Gongylonema pulchrum]|uniref:Uncharacterized protein n=1 Tax=Gongylonema pulchrum TaxID=637853 RepID=A0A183DAS8_9BILA